MTETNSRPRTPMFADEHIDVALIYPPVAKPGEPPAGVAQLKNALQAHGVSGRVIDANLEGLLHLLETPLTPNDTTLRDAQRHRVRNIERMRRQTALSRFDRYKASVLEINRVLQAAAQPYRSNISLTDFRHESLSPARSADLLGAAERPQDNPFFSYFEKELRPRLERLQPRLFGVSLIFLSQALTAFALIGWLRANFPGVRIIVGGGLMTSWMSRPDWHDPFRGLIDACIAGPGEAALLREWGTTPNATHFLPNYDDAPWDAYFSPGRILPYSASAGCWWRKCAFCPETAEQNGYAPTPPSQVIDDLRALAEHQPALIHFLDNALSPALLKRLADEPPPAPWYGYVRFTDDLLDLNFVRKLRRSGCVTLKLGLESGDQSVLDGMQKGIELAQVSAVLNNLKRAGIAAYVYLLFGTPWEGETEARRTLQFVADHADCINWLNAAIFNLPAHSDEAQRRATRSFYEGDLTLYHDFDHPQGWSRAKVRHFLQNEFCRHPAIRPILLANPPAFTSNHAPFFTDHFAKARAYADRLAV